MTRYPDKTFGLRSSTDLYLKLLFDIERLREAKHTKAIQYAAFDCAVTASHILDWVLHELGDAGYLRLTGKARGEKGAVAGFIKRNGALGGLEYCRQIANSVKHVKITMGPVMENMTTGSSSKLEWQDNRIVNVTSYAYIKIDGQKYPVVDLFSDMADQWYLFLTTEGLWVEQPPGDDD
ncbi:hypothetical protein HFO32_22250 [Rhizobium leguminosarum]|uniref:hypothetical protein n=1 Tax=Rhizobium leguminosarum TaxID=384 RepID=UPI001C98175C|nr:hypothetical protein [Rhizobium leguminosarum]MBY5684848.1 hypothetical protein [Rhizobium leguminosarum]